MLEQTRWVSIKTFIAESTLQDIAELIYFYESSVLCREPVLRKPVDGILACCLTASITVRAEEIKRGRIHYAKWAAKHSRGRARAISGLWGAVDLACEMEEKPAIDGGVWEAKEPEELKREKIKR